MNRLNERVIRLREHSLPFHEHFQVLRGHFLALREHVHALREHFHVLRDAAACLILDTDKRTVQSSILKAGLPSILANRLTFGT